MILSSDKINKYKSEVILLAVTLLWGGTFAVIKESLNDASPFLFVSIRFMIASLLLYSFARKRINLKNKELLKDGLIIGILMFLGFALQTLGLKFTTVTKSSFLTGSLVVMIPFLQMIIEKRKPATGAMIGAMLVFAGVMFLSSPGDSVMNLFSDIGSGFNIGDFFTLGCAFSFALYVVMLDVYSKRHSFWELTFMQITVTAVLASLFTLIFDSTGLEKIKFELTGNLVTGLLYTSVLATIVSTLLQTKYQKFISPTKAGIIFSFEPLFATIIAFILLGEKIKYLGYIGCGLIFFGLLVSELFDEVIKNYGKAIRKSENPG